MTSSAPDSLRLSLSGDIRCQRISDNDQAALIAQLWRRSDLKPPLKIPCESYFGFYVEKCSQALHNRGRHASARKHSDVVDVARLLVQPLAREAIATSLSDQYRDQNRQIDDEAIVGSMNLVARLMLMTEVGSIKNHFSGQKTIPWTSGSLQQCMRNYFSAEVTLNDQVKFEKIFNAQNLGRMAGLKYLWTDNLADHLRFIDDDQTVAIFHHATFLKNTRTGLLPEALIDETLRTLSLLFPQSDIQSRKWLQKVCELEKLDMGILKCGNLKADARHIERFLHWRDRLVVLKQVFDENEPQTLGQWWYDQRRHVQWYTFWLAFLILILTVFFGLIQSIEGALQVYKAFHPPS
ncbi:hypothetical protein BDV96DRAFT_531626 [Lophiotrema nucula]|uniref:Uncharacterized protein n=1 Tax=Lophiotrema nucula TaxID=690887 RepID=A0A6A5YL35_9PLEO|nr:hypothetical protein BDV96DRAFT_531626 [Lophiotrema nucula]